MGRVVRGVVAVVGLVVVVVGLPMVALSYDGTRVPDRGEISGFLAGNGQFPARSLLAVVLWLGAAAWVVATAAVVVEAVAYWRGRRASRLPGLGWLQGLAEQAVRSVAGLAMVAASVRGGPPAVASQLRSTNVIASGRPAGSAGPVVPREVWRGRTGVLAGSAVDAPRVTTTLASTVVLPRIHDRSIAAGTKVHVVERRGGVPDTLWRIAETHLGDGERFREIVRLNEGLLQPDGRRMADPHWIYPGWVLVMPPDAVGVPVVAESLAPAGAAVTATPAVPVAPSVQGSVAPAAAPSPPPATAPPSDARRGPSASTAPVGPRAGTAGATSASDSVVPGWLVPAGAGGATLLATWALVDARRRRDRRLRQSRPGFVMPPTDPTVASVTAAVQAASDVAGVDRLQAALYHLASVAERGLRPVVVLRHPDGRIDVQLAAAAEPAEPWTATDRLFWTLDRDAELPAVNPLVVPCPALVQLGVCDDRAELYVDLEAIGILGLTGTAETVRQVARALTATLVVSPAARLCRVLTLGFDPYGLDEQVEDRFVLAKSVESLLHEAEMTAKDVALAIAERDAGSSFRLRALDPDCGWEPTVVVVAGTALANDEVARLETLAGGGGQGAAVVCAGAEWRWKLELVDPSAGWWQLNPLGQRVRPVQMAADELRELAAYLADADAEPVEVPPEPARSAHPTAAVDYDEAPVTSADGTTGPVSAPHASVADRSDVSVPAPRPVSGYVEPDWLVMIRLFGPPDAVNRDGVALGGTGRGAPLQLLAWLVTHRDTATRSGAKDALWGGEDVAARTVNNAVWAARGLLRELADEPADGFIAGSNGRLVPSRLVVSDYELVVHRLAFARREADPAAAAEVLAGGLHLVRGVPLAGDPGWLWADENHLSTNLAMAGSAIATQLAALRLKAGQTETAIDATTVGLEVIPSNEELVRLRIQACIDGGDRRAALTVYEKYEGVTAARGESIGPAIAALRNELLRPGRK